ncbi:hypothetical protein KKB83_00115 [Patescibacteria group bacterium]|nr:hypothetical protein [Patescibacteria group bacterium]
MNQVTDSQQLKEIINGAQDILLVSCPVHDLDKIVSLLALRKALEARGKKTTLLAEGLNKDQFEHIPDMDSLLLETEPRSLRIGIRYDNTPVDKINYENQEGIFEVILSPYSGDFSKEQIEFSYTGLSHDLIFVLGAQDIGSLGTLYDQHKLTLEKNLLVNIDNDDQNTLFGKINLVDTSAETKAQLVHSIINSLGEGFSSEVATLLLTSIMEKTQIMHKDVSSRLLRFSALLLDKNADWKKALEYAAVPVSVPQPSVVPQFPETPETQIIEPVEAFAEEAEVSQVPIPSALISPLARPIGSNDEKVAVPQASDDEAELMR